MSPLNQRVEIQPPLDDREVLYESERAALTEVLKVLPHEIEHIGSSAVAELPGKPVIDIAIRVDDLCRRVPALVDMLSAAGYEDLGEFGLPGRHFLVKGDPPRYHVHIVDHSTDHWESWVRFRDILRGDRKVRQEYVKLKNDLVSHHGGDRARYTAGKTEFVARVLSRSPVGDSS